jgi:hypothetical protein
VEQVYFSIISILLLFTCFVLVGSKFDQQMRSFLQHFVRSLTHLIFLNFAIGCEWELVRYENIARHFVVGQLPFSELE